MSNNLLPVFQYCGSLDKVKSSMLQSMHGSSKSTSLQQFCFQTRMVQILTNAIWNARMGARAGLYQFDPDGVEAKALEERLGIPVIRHGNDTYSCTLTCLWLQ